MKKISVLIPVYDGEPHLRRCIQSVLDQVDFPIDTIEILAINDGSKDASLSILREYEEKYSTIVRVLDQENMGIARTRNKAIRYASGTYSIFIDQDDWIDRDFCKTLYDAIDSNSLDVVSSGFRRPDRDGKIRQQVIPKDVEYGKYRVMAAWAKIHRTSFLREYDITFFENTVGEDSVLTVCEISKTKRWMQLEYCGYNWFYNEASVSNTLQKKLDSGNSSALVLLVQKLIAVGDGTFYFQYFLLRTVAHYLLFAGRRTSRKIFLATAQNMFQLIEQEYPNLYKTPMVLVGPKGESLSVRLVIAVFVSLRRANLLDFFARIYCKGK